MAERYDLSDPDEAVQWLMDMMDVMLERVDRAVDEGNSLVQEEQKVTFQGSQVCCMV